MSEQTVTLSIDGRAVSVTKGTNVIRAAEQVGITIPRFCDHPLLDPVAACRQCMVEVPDAGNGRGMKPQPACALEAMPGMVIQTAATSPVAKQAQQGMLEFLLINHPLDCPMCDKGGECPLQNQSMSDGRGYSRYDGVKRTYPKPVALSQMLLLDRERCVLCQRCTRFGDQISGDSLLSLVQRGASSQIGQGPDDGTISYFAGNVVQICPVGALTSSDYRFQSRPFDLVSTVTTCENCAGGCALRVDQRHGEVLRRLAANDPFVNQEWNCDKGRFGFRYGQDRLTAPLVRGDDGRLVEASWPQALDAAAAGLAALGGYAGVLPGGRLTAENALAYARFARLVLGTDSVDARARRGANAEEAAFMVRRSARPAMVGYDDIAHASRVVLLDFEPEDESPMVYLALRRAVRKSSCQVIAVAPCESDGSRKLAAQVVPTVPGMEAQTLSRLPLDAGTIVLAGERAGAVPGLLTAVEAACERASARLAWVPRRAGEWGAAAAGCLPVWAATGLGGLAMLADAWQVRELPSQPGLDAPGIWAAAARGEIGLLLGGVDVDDQDDPMTVRAALSNAPFIVSLEQRPSEITESADVVLPVAMLTEQAGHYLSWTGQWRPVQPAVKPQPMTDRRVLTALADRMGSSLLLDGPEDALRLIERSRQAWAALPPLIPASTASPMPPVGVVLSTWRALLTGSRCLDGATSLAPRPSIVVTGPAVAAAAGVMAGQAVAVVGPHETGCDGQLVIDPAVAPGVVVLADAPWPSGTAVRLQGYWPDWGGAR